jgi:three-Cys-motif partner protein
MTKNRNERQFDEYREWQWCKHVVLRDYVKPWSVIVGKHAAEIVAVDTCAGAGTYTDPLTGAVISEGSPVIFARRAAAYTAERGPGKSMKLICCESNPNNFASLVESVRPFAPHVTTLRGEFGPHIPTIVEKLRDSPALILLDPIGLKAIRADAWAPLLDRQAKTDIFVVLHFAVVHRIGGMLRPDGTANPNTPTSRANALTLDGVFRGRRWREIAVDPALAGEEHREKRERLYVQLFFDQVIGNRHRWKCAFEVRARYTSPIKYWLVHASDDFKPYMLMNDEIVKLTEMLLERETNPEGQIEGFVEADMEAHREWAQGRLAAAVLARVSGASGQLPFAAIRDQLVGEFFGQVKQGAYSRAVKDLCKSGALERQQRLGAALDDMELISLPTVGPPGTASTIVPIRRAA